MTRSAATQERQAQWHALLSRQAQSGLSVAAFCKREGIPPQTFYWWRARLGAPAGRAEPAGAPAAGFLDLGALVAPDGRDERAALDIRLELPGGIVLTIART